ncbi:thiosulfate oxidation carrier complex protein SoxZ [Thiocystis minor]|uniref:thiosulfate oxidation carrier complex protein SoxZ n=1 Tax=Thiocystis minor TaxID=61597 RepID=UPI001912371A|nr:thiosulfate oxidation carrier complex protein SoxZ [Thiocystis minor]MBK5963028.1 thiosulfate oxidation carrier complex protein SoxZ [Thiocystis minor]
MSDIKIRATLSGEETTVKCLMSHPMETGLRKDSKTGELVPAHFIEEVVCKYKDEVIMTANWSGGVSKNPYLSFKFKGGAAGDPITVTWKDNKGETQSASDQIKG